MDKKKLHKQFEKAVIGFPYADTEELNEEHEFIFEWFWKKIEPLAKKAWMYDDLTK